MITDEEKARMKEVRDALFEASVQLDGEALTKEERVEYVGASMATIDALFAIREGAPWRGITDPQEIAREVLRQGQLSE